MSKIDMSDNDRLGTDKSNIDKSKIDSSVLPDYPRNSPAARTFRRALHNSSTYCRVVTDVRQFTKGQLLTAAAVDILRFSWHYITL
jgi:hypothetical protein